MKIIAVHEIQPNPFQPRESFERESLKELAESIRDVNIIQPIVVRKYGFTYQIIAGERRWRAAQMIGLKKIPCIIKDVPDEMVLFESLIENLHRKNLTDMERENAIHEIWENKDDFGVETKRELAMKLGIREGKVQDDIEAWEFRFKEEIPIGTSTDVIRRTRGLEQKERKQIIKKVDAGEIKASEVDTIVKVFRKAPSSLKRQILKPKSRITPKIAETIMTKLSSEEEQKEVINEVERLKLNDEQVEERIRKISKTGEMRTRVSGFNEEKVQNDTVYIVNEYDCPHCKRHYKIKCDGKQDWLE